MTQLIDVTLPIGPDLLVWPGDPPVSITPRIEIARGDPANVSEITMGTHTGTHVDPPNHFVPGTEGIDGVPLDALDIPAGAKRVLLRTANSELWRHLPVEFPDTYACLTAEGARWVVDRGIGLIGVDFLSVEQKGAPGHPAHHALLENGVVIVEGLNLGDVEPGRYTLVCMPLRIVDGDGGPARAMLIRT